MREICEAFFPRRHAAKECDCWPEPTAFDKLLKREPRGR